MTSLERIRLGAMRVAVIGAAGRMGQTVCAAVEGAPDLELVARLDEGDDPRSLAGLADVAVEFTIPSQSEANVHALLEVGVAAVVGTTGWTEEALQRVREHAQQANGHAFIAPNFALSAVLAMRFAALAAPHFESVEVIELHHPNKVDAPSGTALHTARGIAAARTGLPAVPDATQEGFAARGMEIDGVRVHAVRLAGMVAHEEILLGNPGEVLTIRADSFDRSSFMPGVLLAVRKVTGLPGLTVGLDALLD